MKINIEKSHIILIAAILAWVASIILVCFPTIGVTTTVFPPKPVESYKLVLLIVTAAIASIYSMKMGLNQIFQDGFKIREKVNSETSFRKIKSKTIE